MELPKFVMYLTFIKYSFKAAIILVELEQSGGLSMAADAGM